MPVIHSSSIVDPKAEISDDVEIGPFCYIAEDTKIGAGTRLLNNVTIYSGARIGRKNIIFPGSVLAAVPQDLKFSGEYTELFIGDNNTIRECVTMNRGTHATGRTMVGSNNLFMAYSHVAHDCEIGDNCILANSVALGGHVSFENHVIIGGLTGIHQFVKIGAHAMIGASSMVVKDVLPYALFSGDPLEYKGLNIVGLKRRGFTEEQLNVLKNCYNIIFGSGLNVSQALEKIKTQIPPTEEVKKLTAFIEKSGRGIAK